MIKNLKDITLDEKDLFGPKACNLGHLLRNGFNVPAGFTLSSDTVIDQSTIPEIKRIFTALNRNVAVRSSMTTEDSKKQSFAGQFDTYLDMDTEERLFDAISKCRDSINSSRSSAYTREPIKDRKMSVIIQKMVKPDYSGIIFTIDPVEGKDMLLEIVKGKGDPLASGIVTPESFTIDRNDFHITSTSKQSIIDTSIIEDLAGTAMRIETLFAEPQDIEFCMTGRKIHILQSRPITTL